jgi:SAM-dependent methyltransferase
MGNDFLSVTEVAGDCVTVEQIDRAYQRYYWAGDHCRGKDVLEAACGTGQGAGYLAGLAKSYRAGDYSGKTLEIARRHYGDRIGFLRFDAQEMPFRGDSFDVVVLFEAIYYLPSVARFLAECRRVLRPGGKLLVVTANKDLYDFHPSPYSVAYYGVREMGEILEGNGFDPVFFGNSPLGEMPLRQKVLRPVKKCVVSLGLMPKTMEGKKFLKRIVFGSLAPMPPEILPGADLRAEPTPLPPGLPDRSHKVLFCAAAVRK